MRHNRASVSGVDLIGFSPASACQVPPSLYEATNVSSVGIYDCRPVLLIRRAILSWSSNLTDLTIHHVDVSEQDVVRLSSALASCHKLEKFAFSSEDISWQSVAVIGSSLASLPMVKSISFQEVFELRIPEALDALLSNLATCSSMEELVLSGCRLKSVCLSSIASYLQNWPCLTCLNLNFNDFSELVDDQTVQFIQATNDHARIRKMDFCMAGVPAASALLKKASYTHEMAVEWRW